jgi:hypothetical protein
MRFSTNPDRLDGFATVSGSRNGVHVVRHLLRGLNFSSMVKTMTYLVFGTKYWSKVGRKLLRLSKNRRIFIKDSNIDSVPMSGQSSQHDFPFMRSC